MNSAPSRLRTWLQLLRAPNLFTVPGDPIAGYLLSNSGFSDHTLLLVASSSLCFYGAGLLMNDVVDLDEDLAERPTRPLPAGLESITKVKIVLWILNILGLLLLFLTGSQRGLLAGIGIVASVWSYNHLTKKIPGVGALNMGLCRGLSVMSGALVGPSPTAALLSAIIALTVGLFIAAVTNLARFETRISAPPSAKFLPLLPLILGCFFGIPNSLFSPDKYPAAILFLLPVIGATLLLLKLLSKPSPPLPPLIGAHIRLLLPLQAAVCWFGASQDLGPYFAVFFLALWPASKLISRRFYAS
ncbi:MAG: UbiA family prenyltransferase [Verrucomicrobiota bacterium]